MAVCCCWGGGAVWCSGNALHLHVHQHLHRHFRLIQAQCLCVHAHFRSVSLFSPLVFHIPFHPLPSSGRPDRIDSIWRHDRIANKLLSRYLAPCTCFLPLTSVLVGVCRHRIGRHVLLCNAARNRSHGTPGAGGTGGRSGARCPRTHICDRPTRGPDRPGRNRRDGRATLGSFSVVGEPEVLGD